MSSVVAPPEKTLMTAEEFMELPDDGVYRELIHGEVREFGITRRTPLHAGTAATISCLLDNWLDREPTPRGKILSGGCGFCLGRAPDLLVGIDVAYASAELVARTSRKTSFYDGAPVLAVEILSPTDKHQDVVAKVGFYLEAGVVVWEVDPDFRRVSVHRPGQLSETFNTSQELSADPYLPGFRVSVSTIFDD